MNRYIVVLRNSERVSVRGETIGGCTLGSGEDFISIEDETHATRAIFRKKSVEYVVIVRDGSAVPGLDQA